MNIGHILDAIFVNLVWYTTCFLASLITYLRYPSISRFSLVINQRITNTSPPDDCFNYHGNRFQGPCRYSDSDYCMDALELVRGKGGGGNRQRNVFVRINGSSTCDALILPLLMSMFNKRTALHGYVAYNTQAVSICIH